MNPLEGRGAVFVAVLNNLQEAEEQAERPPRKMYRALDAFELSDNQFIRLFRLDKNLTGLLIEMVTPYLQAPKRVSAVSINTKVLVTLRFCATGSYQEIIGSNFFSGISQSSTSRCISEVTDALNQHEILNNWVKFPNNLRELENLRRRFYDKHQFPGVVGVIDCTHVAIATPSGQEYPEHIYINRKNYHSLNVQLICNEDLKIMNVDARFPGSCNDIHIWKQSSISRIMEQIYRNNPTTWFYLLGDSGYTLRPWLLTPLDAPPISPAEERFDSSLKTIRSSIERCNGVLKNRFRCLLKHRVLHYSPNRASKIVNACVVLHNMCIEAKLPEPDIDNDIEEFDFGFDYAQLAAEIPNNAVNPDLIMARKIQRKIAETYFNE